MTNKVDVCRDHKTNYICGSIELSNCCDKTTNPFSFTGSGYPMKEAYVDIDVLREMKKVIDKALREADNSKMIEYVGEDE